MSVMRELTIAVLLRFAITPKDPITAHVNQDMKETEITAHRQVRNLAILYTFERIAVFIFP